MLDNIEVAIFTSLNDLAERHGLKPYDFVATLKTREDGGRFRWVLDFETPASGNALKEERFDKMLAALGVLLGDSATLVGSVETIVDALDRALEVAPQPRGLF